MSRSALRPALAVTITVAALAGAVAASPADAAAREAVVVVDGSVASPAAYTRAELAALPQTTVGAVTGVAVEDLVLAAQPVLPAAKNATLRVTLTVRSAHDGGLRLALGELDPGFGAHPALLVDAADEIDLVLPGDTNASRTRHAVSEIAVADSSTDVPTGVPAGSLLVSEGAASTTLAPADLALLPQKRVTVSFSAAGVPQTHVEQGPTLAAVLRAAGAHTSRLTAVVAVGSDGYEAAVTPAEATAGGRPLLVSLFEDGVALAQPRTVADGDLKGGRYVSDLVSLDVTP